MNGYEQLKQTISNISKGQSPTRKSIPEMTLSEALDAQAKYLAWRDKYPFHEDADVKEHIYTNYLLPHISELQRIQEDVLVMG